MARYIAYPDSLPAREQSPGPVSINYVDQSQRANHYTTPPRKSGWG